MTETGRIRISLAQGELEVEGNESFVAQYDDDIRALLGRLSRETIPTRLPSDGNGQAGVKASTAPVDSGAEFGEVLHALPRGATGSDQILVAGYFVAKSNGDQAFSTNEANKLLIEQGIKLSNP